MLCVQGQGDPRQHGEGAEDTSSCLPAWLKAGEGSVGKWCLRLCEVQGFPYRALHQDSFPEDSCPITPL